MKPYRGCSIRLPSASTRRSRSPCSAWRSMSRACGCCPADIITVTAMIIRMATTIDHGRRARSRGSAWRVSPRQQHAGRRRSCPGRCRRIRPGHCRAAAGARVRLALDGPVGRPDRRAGDRELVGRVAARYRRHPARSHAGSAHGRESPCRRSKATEIKSPTCIFGGSAPAISAPSSRSRPAARARRRITGSDWLDSPTCPM